MRWVGANGGGVSPPHPLLPSLNPFSHGTMAALLRCPVLARHPWLIRALATAPPYPQPGDPSLAAHCPFIDVGGGPRFVQRAAPEVQEDVAPPEQASLDWLLDLEETPEEIPERRLDDNLPEDAFPYEAVFGGRLAGLKRTHTYRVFTAVGRRADAPPMGILGSPPRPIQLWCSNDYLGMSRHPKVLQAARAALAAHGLGSGGTRNIGGTSPLHGALERALAQLHRQPRAVLFSSCFAANDTAMATLARLLPGSVAPLGALCDVAHAHGALTFVDEVHAIGLYGARGAGVAERDDVMHKVDIVSGTLGKAVGAVGGYIASSSALADSVRSFGAGFIFTTALPPAVVAGALASLRVLGGPEGGLLRRTHQRHAKHLRLLLRDRGLPVLPSPSHIVPVRVGDAEANTRLSRLLLEEHGLYVQAINFPTVPRGMELLRLAPTPHHGPDAMENLADRLAQCWGALGLPLEAPPGPSCSSCHRPLHLSLMSDWEQQLFQLGGAPVQA
ncbi:5-aminolevulinate synthase, erythroid-specific, mitochondrial-like isoform X2 [Colius striatus]|uniref:5-aminolevulinate synthase, erythroid-specific, mitochondrial-like isoform X2 n=1 Tax=Colius striatus TaxID=57412 RepID=UPI002B1E608E|nr:5-aminolevulinate synthase, erythroid-specific, mitochondrial-like isoform X2 [Colius striatus]